MNVFCGECAGGRCNVFLFLKSYGKKNPLKIMPHKLWI